jgi:hypothetical protein
MECVVKLMGWRFGSLYEPSSQSVLSCAIISTVSNSNDIYLEQLKHSNNGIEVIANGEAKELDVLDK